MPLSSRVSFSKNSPVHRLLTLQLGQSSQGREERVQSARLRTVLRAGVKYLRPIGPVRGLCRLRSVSATSMPRFNQPGISDNRVMCLHKSRRREVRFSLQMGGLLVSENAHD